MTDHAAIAVVGGGYAGLFAARRAARALPPRTGRIVLIDPDDVWQERTRWHQLAAGEDVNRLSRARLFRGTGVSTVAATVADIDLDARRLTLVDGSTPALSFDRLVYALGSRTDARGVDGVEHALSLDTAAASRQVAAALRERPNSRVLMVGSGLTGIQTAAQIAENHPAATVTLASSGPVGREFPESTRPEITAALDRLNVTWREDVRVAAVSPTGVDGPQGHREADIVIWTAGFMPSPLAERAGLEVGDTGQMIVDQALRSVSHPFVFAAGDAASVPRAGSPYGAYTATGTGATAGRNAALDLAGQPVAPLNLGYAFLGVSIGRQNAVIQLLQPDGSPRAHVLAGRMAHRIKEGIEHYVVGALKAERHVPGLYHWSPGPGTREPTGNSD